MDLVIRTDGNSEIGFGHLVRSSAISEIARENGVHIAVATATPGPVRDIFADETCVWPLPNRDSPDYFCQLLDQRSVDAVFADAYPVDTEYQREIRQHAPLVVQQDDVRHPICADVLVNGNLYARDLNYEFVGNEPHRCLGPSYVLLREEVRAVAQRTPLCRTPPERAIITMGGSDIANVTPTAVRAFDDFDLTVDVIVGPGVSTGRERNIRTVASDCSATCRVSRDPDDLIDRMFRADFAVTTASTTTYELLAVGTPIISVPVVDNQTQIAAALGYCRPIRY